MIENQYNKPLSLILVVCLRTFSDTAKSLTQQENQKVLVATMFGRR